MINIGIDASNITSGGGLTHLVELLQAVDIEKHNIKNLDVWAPKKTLDKISSKKRVRLKSHSLLEGNLLQRVYWQRTVLTKFAKNNYDVLYVPGGSYIGSFKPVVTMNRNLLPFDYPERKKYRFSTTGIRLRMLEHVQAYTYRRAAGIIFLSKEAKRVTEQAIGKKGSKTKIIPHGIAPRFFQEPRKQHSINQYSLDEPFRFLYVSTITFYKHHWHVINALNMLRNEGYPVVLDLVGSITSRKAGKLFKRARQKYDHNNKFIFYHGKKSQSELLNYYHSANGFIFASSCETFGQTLLESMASGLPIACSDRSALPEVLGDTGQYFDPEDPDTLTRVLKKFLNSPELRQKHASGAYRRAQTYSWKKCATSTFDFIQSIYEP